jgi:integrase
LHDLRHTFACRVLKKWRLKEERIDWLSRYLGHERVSDTYWYFSAVPELFSATVRQFKCPLTY